MEDIILELIHCKNGWDKGFIESVVQWVKGVGWAVRHSLGVFTLMLNWEIVTYERFMLLVI